MDAIEQAAAKGQKMPDGLDIFDQLRFHGLSYIYHNFQKGVTPKETATEYKRSLLKEIDFLRQEYAFAVRCWDSAVRLYKATEMARNAYGTNRTLENADALIAALDGLGRDTT